jgi:hypothetical protein
MEEVLMDCHEREILKQEPCEVASTKHSKGLIERGFAAAKYFTNAQGKKYMALVVTDLGKEYLLKLSKEHNN